MLVDGTTRTQQSIHVGATAGSGGSPIKPNCKYKFDNGDVNDPVTGSCDDDSDLTPNETGRINKNWYRFDAHKPKDLVQIEPFDTDHPSQNGSNYHNNRDYTYQLHDDGNAIMGAVYIVERFTTAQPYNQALSVWSPNAVGTIIDSFWIDLGYAYPTDYWTFLTTGRDRPIPAPTSRRLPASSC